MTAARRLNGGVGGTSVANVLVNDTLNGAQATLSNVNLTQVSTTNAGVTLNASNGSVNVAAGTPNGNYTVTYRICDKANPTICDTATVSVPVVTVDAVNNSGSMVNGITGGQSLANVLVNDTLNGAQATLSNVNLTQVSTTNAGVTLNTSNGSVNVAAGTPNGNYTVTYRICDKANPTFCDTATVTVPVAAIDAVNDAGVVVVGLTGGQSLPNVLVNDTLNGSAALLANVNLTQVSTTNAGVTLNSSDGSVNVAPGTPNGVYTVTYQICDKLNPGICDTATVSVPVGPMNFGNLPSSYTNMNLLAAGGARHLTGTTYLGANVPSELDGTNAATFTPDATNDDGVTWTSQCYMEDRNRRIRQWWFGECDGCLPINPLLL